MKKLCLDSVHACQYRSPESEQVGKKYPYACIDFTRGRCFRGSACKFAHNQIKEFPPGFEKSFTHLPRGKPFELSNFSWKHRQNISFYVSLQKYTIMYIFSQKTDINIWDFDRARSESTSFYIPEKNAKILEEKIKSMV